jgi:ATP-binding protein involved in chromosome partitioning
MKKTMEVRVGVIDKRLQDVKRIISIASGKGGVGKSLVACTIALHLSRKGRKVGLLDLDLYGPSSHVILGVKDLRFPEEEKGIVPPLVHDVRFMSIVYFTKDKPASFRGADVTNILLEILAITQWGNLDYLIIDMPPGLGDETLDVIRFIKKGEFLVVTTPSKVSMKVVAKLLSMLKELNLPILGLLENMKMSGSSFIENMADEMKIPYLGSVFFDENLEEAIGDGERLLKTRFMQELSVCLRKINI